MIKHFCECIYRQIEASAMDPRPSQERALRRILKCYSQSTIVKKVGLKPNSTLEDLRHSPVTDYPFIQDDLDAAWKSGEGTLAFAQTSGTTSKPKYIPINSEYLAAMKRFVTRMAVCTMHHAHDYRFALSGKTINLGNRPCTELSPTGLPVGYISGIALERSSWWVRRRTLPSLDVLAKSDWNEKMKLILAQALLPKNRHQICAVGALPALGVYFIRYALDSLKVSTLSEVFPELRYFMYSGEFLTPSDQEKIIRWVCGPDARPFYFINLYSASEGQLGHALDPKSDAMVFNSLDVVYQFRKSESSEVIQLHEVVAGEKYQVLVTTPGGMINFWFGDWVEILSTRPILFRLAGRDQDEISVSAEKINVGQLTRVAAQIEAKLGFKISDFAVWLNREATSYLTWVIPGSKSYPDIGAALDRQLSELNDLFADHLRNGILYRASEVIDLPQSDFESYHRKQVLLGQAKPRKIFKSQSHFETEFAIKIR